MRVKLTAVMVKKADGDITPALIPTLQGAEASEVRGLDLDETRKLEAILEPDLRDRGLQLVGSILAV